MQLETILAGLRNPNPTVRLDVVRVLAMAEETRALDALRAHLAIETDAVVREATRWAGQRILAAQQAGYSTVAALFEHFGINREIEHAPDEAEAELLRKMETEFDRDFRRMKEGAVRRRAGTALIAGIGGMMAGGAIAGAGMMSAALAPGADRAESSLSTGHTGGHKRMPPTAPTAHDITLLVQRLRGNGDAVQRERAAAELAQLNNPAALPHLAAAFVSDPSTQVRQAAERFGKILYWSQLYWHMEQQGEIEAEIQRRVQTRAPRSGSAEAPPPPDVGGILRKAQENRSRRNKNT